CGPGLGRDPGAIAVARTLAREVALPLVLDVDGLNAFAGEPEALRDAPAPRVLTPHPGEMARLAGRSVPEIQADRLGSARAMARSSGAVVVLKGAGTWVASPDGRACVNTTGGANLGTGGTGDVLAGLIAALLAQGLDPFAAARLGAFLHGLAGDRVAARSGDAGLLASELADEIPLARAALARAGREGREERCGPREALL
ncbi:MAG: NAD(P)H-hydrate dehydratase, partial [Alphaproteobacteria bacterium]